VFCTACLPVVLCLCVSCVLLAPCFLVLAHHRAGLSRFSAEIVDCKLLSELGVFWTCEGWSEDRRRRE